MSELGTIVASPKAVTLGMIIAWIETKNDPQAVRFEPKIHAHIYPHLFSDPIIANIRDIHHCTYETACFIYSSSFGKYQMMGFNLYDPGFINSKATVFSYCGINDIASHAQDSDFSTFLIRHKLVIPVCGLLDVTTRNHFALTYNGGLAYADSILESLNHFGIH